MTYTEPISTDQISQESVHKESTCLSSDTMVMRLWGRSSTERCTPQVRTCTRSMQQMALPCEFEAEVPDKEFPEGAPGADIESATLMDGVVYAPVRIGVFDAEAFHTALVAVDAETDKKLWRRDAPVSDEFSTVTAVDGSPFVSGQNTTGDPNQTDTASNSESPTSTTDTTTATDGPWFSLLTVVASVGVGTGRYLTTE